LLPAESYKVVAVFLMCL